ncbi:hypothetical protein ABZ372_37175, partial [Streptomyces sp. NPDC005921]
MTTADTQHVGAAHKTVTVIVDEEPVPGVPQHTTPNEILQLAGIDPATHYLVLVNGTLAVEGVTATAATATAAAATAGAGLLGLVL